jgi:hypothetical protein
VSIQCTIQTNAGTVQTSVETDPDIRERDRDAGFTALIRTVSLVKVIPRLWSVERCGE